MDLDLTPSFFILLIMFSKDYLNYQAASKNSSNDDLVNEECIEFSLWVKAQADELGISEDYFLMEFI